jgi:hypothetical protein
VFTWWERRAGDGVAVPSACCGQESRSAVEVWDFLTGAALSICAFLLLPCSLARRLLPCLKSKREREKRCEAREPDGEVSLLFPLFYIPDTTRAFHHSLSLICGTRIRVSGAEAVARACRVVV